MNLYETIKELASYKKISIRQLEEKLNIANGTIRRWKNSSPSTNTICKVADYFHVSIDSLVKKNVSEAKQNIEYYEIQRKLITLSRDEQTKLLKLIDIVFN